MKNKILKIVELVSIFVLLPIGYYFNIIPGHKSIPLIIVFVICLTWLLKNKHFDRRKLGFNSFKDYRILIARLVFATVVIAILTNLTIPESLLYLPKNMFKLWVFIMLLYPLWSAFPQELIYRSFFLERYKDLFPNRWILILVNSLLFGFLHFIFGNWIAVVGASIMGFVFSYTYSNHQSLLIVSIEHAIVGDIVFTLGLGRYFYIPDF